MCYSIISEDYAAQYYPKFAFSHPLFYEEYPGSINDVSQFGFLVDKVIEYGYRRMDFILDRGYFCKDNIRYMGENGYSFIIMVKGMNNMEKIIGATDVSDVC